MCNGLMRHLLVVAVGLVGALAASAAPRPADKESEQEKAVKAFVAQVITAVGAKDIDAIVGLSSVPFTDQPGAVVRDEKELWRRLRIGLQEKPKFEGKHEVKRVRTFREVKPRLDEVLLKDYQEVLTDDDLVVHVEVQIPDRKLQARLLIKMVDGKPRLVGLGKASQD